jgi:hypothetical protein
MVIASSSAPPDPTTAPTARPAVSVAQGATAKVLRSSSPKTSAAPVATAAASPTGGGLGQGLQLKKN